MRWSLRIAYIALMALILVDSGRAQDAPVLVPIEYVPYAVAVHADVSEELRTAGFDTEASQAELKTALGRRVGPRWETSFPFESSAEWARPSVWNTLQATTAKSHIDAASAEFHYLIRVHAQAGIPSAEVRVWEPLVSAISPVRIVAANDPRELPERIAEAAWELFRPRGHWQKVDDATVRLQIQAAGLGVDSGLPPLIEPGDAFVPWIVLRKRDQSVDRIVPQPWTYLIASQLADGRGEARIASGFRSPLTLKPRGRVEFLAIAARPQWNESTITFRRQSSPPEVLAAHEVQLQADQFPIDEEHPPTVSRQLTDRFGKITVARDPAARLKWLSISSGRQLLARLPVIPGEEHQREVMLSDDRLRLQVEGQLQSVESDLVSFVATRTALIAITRAAARKGEWDNVDARVKQLNALPTPQSFQDRVNSIRVLAVAKARAQKDRTSEQRIARMADETGELVSRYLNDDKLAVLKEEVAELRSAAVDDPAPKNVLAPRQ